MTEKERLQLRARQILDDPTLHRNDRIKNPAALLKQLKATMAEKGPDALTELLDSISDAPTPDAPTEDVEVDGGLMGHAIVDDGAEVVGAPTEDVVVDTSLRGQLLRALKS